MTDPFTLRIRLGDREVELRGTREDVLTSLADLPRMVEQVAQAFAHRGEVPAASPAPTTEYPSLTVDPSLSCPEAIQQLLATPWGRTAPRKLGEILEAMRVNAIHYPVGTVKGRLTDLTKRGVLRRIKGPGGYGYLVATN
jgi:hypothetical protein